MASGPEKRSRPAPGFRLGLAAIFTLTLAAGCGKGDDAAPRQPDAARPTPDDTVPAPVEDAVAVPLPEDFPTDLPLPPGATVVAAEASADEAGTAASAMLVTSTGADDTLSWYARALADAGWQIAERGSRSLHAVQGESYAEVTVTVTGPNRTVLEARIWRAGR